MTPAAGDWVMSAPAGKPDIFQRGILMTGARHTHDEMVADVGGTLYTGNAHHPHFELTPLDHHIANWQAGRTVFAVFRWRRYCTGEEASAYAQYQVAVSLCLTLMADLALPYDKAAIITHGRNFLRERLRRIVPILGTLAKHREAQVYCTESCYAVAAALDRVMPWLGPLDLPGKTGNQPLPAPIHAERLYRDGWLQVVADYGLLNRFAAGR